MKFTQYRSVNRVQKRTRAKSFYRSAIRAFPKKRNGDYIFSLAEFLRVHRRFPSNENRLSDYLFRLKTGDTAYNPLRAYISDKEFVNDYVRSKVGDKFNVPTIAVLHNFEEARSFAYPKRCCIKPTHLSGIVILRENGEDIDLNRIKYWFDRNHYNIGREKNYRFLNPKIIVEPLIFDSTQNEDLKFFCYRGKVKLIQVDVDRQNFHRRIYFDRNWNRQDFSILKPLYEGTYQKPRSLDKMIGLADKLSEAFEFIRVDLYAKADEIFVGELTNWPENGNTVFSPRQAEEMASDILFGESV